MDLTSAMPKLAPFALLHGRPDHGEFAWFCMAGTSSLAPRLLARPVPVYSTARAAQELASLLHAAPPPWTPGDARAPLDVYGCCRADRIRRRFFLPVSGQRSFSRWWTDGRAFVFAFFAVSSRAHGCTHGRCTWLFPPALRTCSGQ
jgi:hypothetical protein